jgi:hypothetical protein
MLLYTAFYCWLGWLSGSAKIVGANPEEVAVMNGQ